MRYPTTAMLTGLGLVALAACSDTASRLAAPATSRESQFAATGQSPSFTSGSQGSAQNGNDHGPMDKITICHAAGRVGTTHYVEITVSRNASYAHLDEHGTPQAGHEEDYYAVPGQGCSQRSTIVKTLVGVMKSGATVGSMIPDPSWTPGSSIVVIPIGETRWLDYEVSYTLPSGVTGTITEDSHAVCSTLGTFVLQCSFNLAPTSTGVYSWSVTGPSGSVTVPIDLGGGGAGSCGDHIFTNTAKLTPSVGSPATAQKDITVRVTC
jgi:hypothetical protein